MEKNQALAALAALAQETRLDIFRLLVRTGPPGLPAGAIGEGLQLAGATLSFHLKELKQAGLIHPRRDGRMLIYAADFAAMNALLAFLGENCCRDEPSGARTDCAPFAGASTSESEPAK
jgi:ArsR family transcriptional regulator, arsenate/arsenite/antimonite-responsive transcriptional repressor